MVGLHVVDIRCGFELSGTTVFRFEQPIIIRNTKITTAYIVSQLAVWEIEFPGGNTNDNIKWRAFIWAISEAFLVFACALTYLPRTFLSSSVHGS